MRQNIDYVFSVMFNNFEDKSEHLDVEICIPRICKRQTNRYNILSNSPEEYFKNILRYTIFGLLYRPNKYSFYRTQIDLKRFSRVT